MCRERIYLSTVVGWALSSVGSVRKRWKRKGRNVGRCCFVFSFCWVHSETIQSCCYYWIIVVIYMTFLFQILYTHTHPLLVKKSSNKIWLSNQFFNRNLFASASTFPKQSAHVISIWNSLVISLPPPPHLFIRLPIPLKSIFKHPAPPKHLKDLKPQPKIAKKKNLRIIRQCV